MIWIALSLLLWTATSARAHWTSARPDGHAPIGVMGEHTHSRGEWMVSYRYMWMDMEGSLLGSSAISDLEVVSPAGQGFIVTPTRMTMGMHMLGAMYAPSDTLTLMAMVPSVNLEMDHLTRAGGRFTTSSSGIGDLRLTALWKLFDSEGTRFHLNLGVSAPTGSIDEADVTPASAPAAAQLPYPMQLGSGTWDAIVGGTWLGQSDRWSWGGQGIATVRTGENDRDYTLGDRFDATAWIARRAGTSWSWSGRLALADWSDIDGADPRLAGAVASRLVPTVFPDLRGGSRLDFGVGLNFEAQSGVADGLRVALEYLVPVVQDLDGPQLETDVQWVLGVQYAF